MEYLRVLFRTGIFDLSWGVRELATQLYSPDEEIIATALDVLEELCTDRNNLKAFIETRPQPLTTQGRKGTEFLIKFLGSITGLDYLSNFDFVDKELKRWRSTGNVEYVRQVENLIVAGLSAVKYNYALKLPTPVHFTHHDSIEVSWIRKLPFSMHMTVESEEDRYSVSMQIFVEVVDNKEVYLVGKSDTREI
jgi:hypothetical protein